MTDNPLLKKSDLPNFAPAFDKIEIAHFLPAIEAAIEEAREKINALKDDPARPDFTNTVVVLETAAQQLGTASSIFYNQLSAAGNDELQKLAGEIGPLNAEFSNDVLLDPVIFARVKAVYEQKEALGLTTEEETLLEDTWLDFVRGGALLEEEKKTRLREISKRLSVLGPTFMDNVKKATEDYELLIDEEADLAGLPESAIDSARDAAEEKDYEGKWLFTLDAPSYGPFVKYADNRALRENIWRAYNSRAWNGSYDNSAIILEIVRLRDERAKLLGYDNHAHFVLERRMAETPDQVQDFLETLKKAYKEAAQQDLVDIREFAASIDGPAELKPWDIAYYAEKLKQERFEFSSEDLRPYFPLNKVLAGCFDHFWKLFRLRFEENKAYPVWHKDVTAYDVFDEKNDRFIGTFYADFFPRVGKKNGAWKTGYRSQGLYDGKVERPVVAIVCNFTKPTKDKPSLLTHGEVLTLFHEMGHAVHALMSDVTYQSLAGTNVKWDFVELPSQLQENWVYQKETLDMISGHYKTGEKIPRELIDKLNKAKNFMVGWSGLRQISFAMLDMAWHSTDPTLITDVAVFEDDVTEETSLFDRMAGPMSTAFGHLFAGGYAAGYYSYKWAEVLEADVFEVFTEKGLYDQATAESYIKEILSKGGSEHPDILFKRFRGRAADPKALLRREGLSGDGGTSKAA